MLKPLGLTNFNNFCAACFKRGTGNGERGTVNCTKKHTLNPKLYFFYDKKRAKCEKKHSLGDSCTLFMTNNEHASKITDPTAEFPDPLLSPATATPADWLGYQLPDSGQLIR